MTQNKIKKASDYAIQWRNAGRTSEELSNIWREMMSESLVLINLRNAQSDYALSSIIRELEEKWKAFAKLEPMVKPDGFMLLFEHMHPELYEMLEQIRLKEKFQIR